MEIERHIIKAKRAKVRAIELYTKNTPFKHRIERNRVKYNRKAKHRFAEAM